MKSILLKSALISTVLAGNSLPAFAMEVDPESRKSIPMSKKKTFELCKKFQEGPEESFTQSTRILGEQSDHLESLLELYDIANSFLDSENIIYQTMASQSFDRIRSFVDDESQPLRKRLRIAGLLASLTMQNNKVKNYGVSLNYHEFIIGNEFPYHDGGLWWTLDALLEAKDASTEQKVQAHRLLMAYAQKFDEEKLGAYVLRYIDFLKEEDMKGKEIIIEPLKILEDRTEKDPSYLSYLWLAKAYESLYGLDDHEDVNGNFVDASLTREAYKNAATYYPESAAYIQKLKGYYHPHLDGEETDLFSFLGDNRSIFFKDSFEYYIFVQKAFAGVEGFFAIHDWGFDKWLAKTSPTDNTEEGKIARLLYGLLKIRTKDTLFEEGSAGSFIAEGIQIEGMRDESRYLISISDVMSKINIVSEGIKSAIGTDLSRERPLYCGERFWDYSRGVWKYPYYFSSVEDAEGFLAKLSSMKEKIEQEKNRNASERKRMRADRIDWLNSQDVETVYELTRFYNLTVQNDFPLLTEAVEDYRLILESLVAREHEEAKGDLEILNDKFPPRS